MRRLDIFATTTSAIARRTCEAIRHGLVLPTAFDRLRMSFIILIVVGPIIGVAELHGQQRVDDILQRGVATEAAVTRTVARTGRSSTYTIDLGWRDAQGAQHRVEQLTVSPEFFGRITRISSPKVRIKYLADQETSRRSVALPDDLIRYSDRARLIAGSLFVSLVGVAGVALMTLWRSWRRRRATQTA